MRHHLRTSGIWGLAVGAVALLGVALAGHSRTSTPATTSAPSVARTPAPTTPAVAPIAAAEPSATPAPVVPTVSDENDPTLRPGESGMLVGIDPETGRIGKPPAELRERLQATLPDPALDRSMEGIELIHKPDGSIMADLKGRFADYTVVRITPEGRKIEACVQGPEVEEALRHANDEASAAPTPRHEVR